MTPETYMINSQLAIFQDNPDFVKRSPKRVSETAIDRKIRKELEADAKYFATKRKFEPLEHKISFTPDHFTIYTDYSVLKAREGLKRAYAAKAVERIYNTGRLSRGAASKMKLAGSHLFMISKPKKILKQEQGKYFYMRQSIITLTLSEKQKHPDNWIKKNMLNDFLDAIQHRYPGISYWWKAERQGVDANFNIHFHIVTDHFIPYQYTHDLWNRIQKRTGYLKKWSERKVKDLLNSSDLDGRKYELYSPPSTETKKVRNEADMGKYMRKYLCKNFKHPIHYLREMVKIKQRSKVGDITDYDKRAWKRLTGALKEAKKPIIAGKLWGCTDNLLLVKKTVDFPDYFFKENQHAFEHAEQIPMNSDNFEVYKITDYEGFLRKLSPEYKIEFKEHYIRLISPHRPPADLILKEGLNYSYKKIK